jgi:hypothetical protein
VVVESWQAAGVIFAVGKAVLTLHPPLRPLSHNVNLRDGAQDICQLMVCSAARPVSDFMQEQIAEGAECCSWWYRMFGALEGSLRSDPTGKIKSCVLCKRIYLSDRSMAGLGRNPVQGFRT